jgi:tellurium resistance protein TerZ
VVYFGNLKAKNGSVKHSGDDLTGDMGGDDGLDNEVITVDFGAYRQLLLMWPLC